MSPEEVDIRLGVSEKLQGVKNTETPCDPNHQQKWIYAFQTCAKERYVHQLEGQLRTWAANVSKEQMLIIGGPHNNGEGEFACDEGPRGQNCKEATVLYRASQRAEEVGADWLFHVIDDAYLFLPRVHKAMAAFDPSEPLVFANFGCGKAWAYHAEYNGKPRPATWVEPTYHCDAAWQKGGICTAAGYIVSRAALKLLRRNHTLPSFVKHYTSLSVGRASDISTSCLFYDRGVTIKTWPGTLQMATVHGDAVMEDAGSIAAREYVGSVHVSITNHSKIPLFMEELHKIENKIE